MLMHDIPVLVARISILTSFYKYTNTTLIETMKQLKPRLIEVEVIVTAFNANMQVIAE